MKQTQAITKERAVSDGKPWTAEEDMYILEDLDDAVRDVALAPGRTLEAVSVRKRAPRE